MTLDLPPGQFTAIMGPSGSGKSTLMHCLAGLDTLTSGQVLVGGTDLASLTDRDRTILRRDRLGFVFQAFNLLPTLTAEENITLPVDLAGRAPDRDVADTVVDKLNLRDRLGHRPSELSGGQQQRVAVARALIYPARRRLRRRADRRPRPQGRHWSCCASCGPWSTTWARRS